MSTSTAIVASAPGPDWSPGSNWELTKVQVPSELKDGEILVEMVASGICHTDFTMTSGKMPVEFPMVAGHEGSGYVQAVGPNVSKDLHPGDPVLLSFDSCASCAECRARNPAYCESFTALNLFGHKDVLRSHDGSAGVHAQFFGHSSFSKLSIVKEQTVLPVKDFIRGKEELQLFAPLGCGIQTGAGAILNLVKAGPKDRVMVTGLGGVGLSAVMAARIAGCEQIIAVDRLDERIDLAKKVFGATHGLNTVGVDDMKKTMKEVAGGLGPTVVIETTGFPPVLEAALQSLAIKGTYVQIGGPADPSYRLSLDLVDMLFRGIKIMGCVEGDSYPANFIPQLIEHYRKGKLPVNEMVKYYKAENFKEALHDMHNGSTIKPVLLW